MLAYRDVGFRYAAAAETDRDTLAGIALAVPTGAFLLLLGGNGSGKSTLLRMANGLIPHVHAGAFRGTVFVAGCDTRARAVRDLARTVGIVFQNHEAHLFSGTVARELAFGPAHLGLPRAEILCRCDAAAARAGVAHLMARETPHLSGGEQARVAIAAVLAMQPRLLILDEPAASLDPAAAASLRELIADLHAQGTTIIATEHRPEGMWAQASAVAALDAGRLIVTGAPTAVLRDDALTARLPVPTVTRLFAAAGLPERPCTVTAAAARLRARGVTLQPAPRSDRAPGERLLAVRGVRATRGGREVLHDVGFDLRRGTAVALVGPNGAGKTTLLRLLAGLARPERGTITDENGGPLAAARVGLLLQNADDALFCRTVREEIAYSARALRRHDPAWIAALVEQFALAPLLDRPPLALSDGERRRVALAATLAHRPDLILLDEPTVGQDDAQRAALATLFRDLRAAGAALLVATHDLAFAAQHCARWLVLADGAMTETTPARAFADPALMADARLVPTPVAALAAALGVSYPGEDATLAPAIVNEGRR